MLLTVMSLHTHTHTHTHTRTHVHTHMWNYNKVRELIVVKVLHNSLLNTTVVTFKVLHLGSYAPIPAPSPPFKTILELVLWNVIQSCPRITPDGMSSVLSKCLPFNISFIFGNIKSHWGLDPVNRQGVPTQLFV